MVLRVMTAKLLYCLHADVFDMQPSFVCMCFVILLALLCHDACNILVCADFILEALLNDNPKS